MERLRNSDDRRIPGGFLLSGYSGAFARGSREARSRASWHTWGRCRDPWRDSRSDRGTRRVSSSRPVSDFRNLLTKEFLPFGTLSDQQLAALERHYSLLTQWNQRMNLTRIEKLEDVVRLHYCESLFLGLATPSRFSANRGCRQWRRISRVSGRRPSPGVFGGFG